MKFSVITINYNNQEGLEATILSVLEQDYPNFEYIIIDGGSTDGSVEVVDKYSERIKHFVSERDEGVYHAMNKGINVSSGEYLIFMNSGDLFFDNKVLSTYNEEIDGVHSILYGQAQGVKNGVEVLLNYPKKLNLSQWLFDTIGHQASAIKSSLFNDFGFYNENSKITADWQFFTKMYLLKGVQFKYLDKKLAIVDLHGISSDPNLQSEQQLEREEFIQSELPQFWDEYLTLRKTRFVDYMSRRERQLYFIRKNMFTDRWLKLTMDFLSIFVSKKK